MEIIQQVHVIKYCGAISHLFHNIFNVSLSSGVNLHVHLLNVTFRFIFSSILQIWYVEVRISRESTVFEGKFVLDESHRTPTIHLDTD